ncbi:MAG: response regulator [Candidatus Omnitrophota bacterium]
MLENKKRILVIDDDDNVCRIVREGFESVGYQVLTANNADEGLQKTVQGKPQCVLLDIKMPKGTEGLTCLRNIRSFIHKDPQEQSRIRETPVIILTGTGTSMQTAFEMEGVSGFFEKPFNLTHLQSKIEDVLKLR